MATIEDWKEQEAPETPLFLFDCVLASGDVQRWSSHAVTYNGLTYTARILQQSADETADGVAKISLTLANADSYLSPIERTVGWKGAQLTVTFLFWDARLSVPASDTQVVFRGTANPPEESTESYLKLSFTNRLNMQRVYLPEVRIQKRCPWSFPTTASQSAEATDGGAKGKYSPFFRCGYSAGEANGVGNLNLGTPFSSCDYTRASCTARGMFDVDHGGNVTRRFGGVEFVPSSVIVRSYGEKGSHVSTPLDNQARYNDFVPLIYGTGWYLPPIVFARNDGNLTHTEVLLGAGEMTSVVKVIVNDVEIPAAVNGANMTATGWYNVVTLGTRTGAFNTDFLDAGGKPAGDPYGSLACLSVVVPNNICDGRSLPEIQVLAQGMRLPRFDASSHLIDEAFTNNPAWVMLDVLRRTGWTLQELDLSSFSTAAQRCDEPISSLDLNGNATLIPRFQCNLLLTSRRSAADIVRGIRNCSGLYLVFDPTGLLQLKIEDTLAVQQPVKAAGSNSKAMIQGGWPAYEFGDNAYSGILRTPHGSPSFRSYARPAADAPNRVTVEFQDEYNEYQQDSLSLVDLDDSLRGSQEITSTLTALGIPNFDQATRVTLLQLNKSIRGNLFVDFQTSVRALGLRPGDLITFTYAKEGWDRQLFRITRVSPAKNYRTASITAQIHDDAWYTAEGSGAGGSGRTAGYEIGLPRPLLGSKIDANGVSVFDISEWTVASTDGSVDVQLSAGFVDPVRTMVAGSGVPLVSLSPIVSTSGGTLAGGQNLYYSVTAVDASGAEGALSFLIKAELPAGINQNQVTLQKLSFPSSAVSFNVYRGVTPAQLLRIASNIKIAGQFNDDGLPATQAAPPDVNFDHANFYWRIELQPETTVDLHSPLTVGNATLHMLINDYSGAVVRITKGLGAGQERTIAGNSSTTVTVTSRWDTEPDATSWFVVAESSWQFGATGVTSPVVFTVPNRQGTTVQVSGRSANIRNDEAAYDLSPLTRYQIAGAGGSGLDKDVPPAPTFGVTVIGQGMINIESIAFPSPLTNVMTVTAGTLTLRYWDELTGARTSLAVGIDPAISTITLTRPLNASADDIVQVDSELMRVRHDAVDSLTLSVERGAFGSSAASHSGGVDAFQLEKKTFVIPFARGFFGSLASGDYSYPIYLPDKRIGASELFVTNSLGNSDVTRIALTATADKGLRTLSGGQISIQVEGMMAIQTNAAPPISVDSQHSVRDVYASLRVAPGADVVLELTQDGAHYCSLTIPAGSNSSDAVDGFVLGPLGAKALLGLNITSVSQTSDLLPGTDLTVTIRL